MLRLGRRRFGSRELLVMAVVNRTPDSFYDRGATFELGAALEAVDRAVAGGAQIVDVGGVRAGADGEPVDAAEEIRRVVPVVSATRATYPDLVISVDTWRGEVARAVVAEGCDLLNDAWGGVDPSVAEVAAESGAGLVCSHAGGYQPRTDPYRVEYADVVADVVATCTRLAANAVEVGVRPDGIVLDPCHDFAKNTYHSLELTRRLDELTATGWPVLVAMSNKDFIGETLDLPVDQRGEGTLAATVCAALAGARIFRAHDVVATRRALDMVAAIRGDRPPAAARRGLV